MQAKCLQRKKLLTHLDLTAQTSLLRVDTFGILDATIIFQINDQGFINAKILVKDRKEQVLGYEAPEADVEGWAVEAPPAHSPEKSDREEKERKKARAI